MANIMGGRVLILVVVITLLLIPVNSVDSFPNGVGSIGNDGCLCHGEGNSATKITIDGIPTKFESNQSYNLTLTLENEEIEPAKAEAQGGFRIILDGGSLNFTEEKAIYLEGGWTHQESGNKQRSWQFTWQSPDDNTSMSKFTILGNAVNGNGYSSGDNWYSMEIYVPGMQNFEPGPNQLNVKHELEVFDKIMLFSGLAVLLFICFRVIRD